MLHRVAAGVVHRGGVRAAAARGHAARDVFFRARVWRASTLFCSRFLLRRIMRWWGTHALWLWLVAGAGVGFALILLLAEANTAWINWNAPVTGPIHIFSKRCWPLPAPCDTAACGKCPSKARPWPRCFAWSIAPSIPLREFPAPLRRRTRRKPRLNFPLGHKACSQFSAPVPIIDFALFRARVERACVPCSGSFASAKVGDRVRFSPLSRRDSICRKS